MSGVADQGLGCEGLLRVGGEVLEGPCWDGRTGRLWFVDIPRGTIFSYGWADRRLERVDAGEAVSAVIPRVEGGAVVACRRGVATLAGDDLRLGMLIDEDISWMRTNDAKCDPYGRLWVGTMADDASPRTGSLYRISADWTRTTVLTGVSISNGLGWSPDGRRMYYIDSPIKTVDVLDYDPSTGNAVARRVLIDTAEYPGMPDGMAVDAEGCLWVAFFGGGAVRRFSPGGSLLATIEVPDRYVTSCAFAGPELDHLVITTGQGPDSAAGGNLFVARPGVPGLPTAAFAG
ncbi:SMP-30/gluconolactonase/LRE family protein [Kribbella solani]|uniref:Sugar lactone lactonase YvrE n=2 Tax=Kribbella solani TaxID=236067 RepID=A0A841DXQ0_9ACTN|nr:SMP-30/gluconolactonase/LRE family protein [Kribbella solani]MBB5982889.1 sugar lactone lactonase YvrE [Kribbella solani]